MSKEVLIPIADGIEDLETATIVDILRRACAKVTIASVSSIEIVASRGMKIVADALIADCLNNDYDAIVLPGGMPGAENLSNCQSLVEMLKLQKKLNKLIAAICASPAVVLAAHNIIDDVKATCYPLFIKKLPNASDSSVVVDKNIITSQGPATAIAMSLKIVEKLYDKALSDKIAKALLYQA